MIHRIDKIGIVQNPKFNTPEDRIKINQLVLDFCSYTRDPDSDEMGALLYDTDLDNIIEYLDEQLHDKETNYTKEFLQLTYEFFVGLHKEIRFHTLDKILFLD